MKKINYFILGVLFSSFSFSQNELDAIRYSYLTHGGSSRYQGMGGALGGLGADFSVASTNPGALGRFSNHKISISFDNNITTSRTNYNNNSKNDIGNKFTISNLSAVFTKNIAKKNNKWKYIQFGLGYNRTTNFSTKIEYNGINKTSLINVFANLGQEIEPNKLLNQRPFSTNLAYESYAVDYNSDSKKYIPRFNNSPKQHNGFLNRDGGVGEYSFSISANYGNKYYVGGSINLQSINYSEEFKYSEKFIDTTGGSLREMTYYNSISAKGLGINLKLGIVFLPLDWLRIGFAFHTPTSTHFRENFSSNMSTVQLLNGKDTTFNVHKNFIPSGKYKYRLTSPLRSVFSLGIILKKRIALGVDFELTNYSWSELKNTTDTKNFEASDFNFANSEIRKQLGIGVNIRLGIEYLMTNNWSLRSGFGLYTSPYKNGSKLPLFMGSFGVGYRIKMFSIDLSYSFVYQQEKYFPFDPSTESNLVKIDKFNNRINLGISFTL